MIVESTQSANSGFCKKLQTSYLDHRRRRMLQVGLLVGLLDLRGGTDTVCKQQETLETLNSSYLGRSEHETPYLDHHRLLLLVGSLVGLLDLGKRKEGA